MTMYDQQRKISTKDGNAGAMFKRMYVCIDIRAVVPQDGEDGNRPGDGQRVAGRIYMDEVIIRQKKKRTGLSSGGVLLAGCRGNQDAIGIRR